MYIIGFLLLIISISKVLLSLSISKDDLDYIVSENNIYLFNPNIIPSIILLDGLLGTLAGLFILV